MYIYIHFLHCRFVGNKSCIRDVSSRFSMGESSFYRCCNRVFDFLMSKAATYIKFPTTEEEKIKVSQKFEEVNTESTNMYSSVVIIYYFLHSRFEA